MMSTLDVTERRAIARSGRVGRDLCGSGDDVTGGAHRSRTLRHVTLTALKRQYCCREIIARLISDYSGRRRRAPTLVAVAGLSPGVLVVVVVVVVGGDGTTAAAVSFKRNAT